MLFRSQGLAAAGYTAGSVPILRAQRFVAEMMLRQGDLEAAWAQSAVVVEKLVSQSGNTAIELGQALALQSRIEAQRGHASQAERLHARALELLRQQLPADHPLLARAPTAKAVL